MKFACNYDFRRGKKSKICEMKFNIFKGKEFDI